MATTQVKRLTSACERRGNPFRAGPTAAVMVVNPDQVPIGLPCALAGKALIKATLLGISKTFADR